MKIKELIEKLKEFDLELDVYICGEVWLSPVQSVRLRKGYNKDKNLVDELVVIDWESE